jgi:pimeloyl-ACP methyl ester carboxylesterase
VVGCSFGAGVAVEVALARPDLVASLCLAAPGGALIPAMTPQLRAFIDAENEALERGDLDAATDANVRWWVDGPDRDEHAVDAGVRETVRTMQRRAFELTADWADLEQELEPPASERYDEIAVPTLVLLGGSDLDAIGEAADRLTVGVAGVRRVDWEGVAHLPSMERPAEFASLLLDWLGGQRA